MRQHDAHVNLRDAKKAELRVDDGDAAAGLHPAARKVIAVHQHLAVGEIARAQFRDALDERHIPLQRVGRRLQAGGDPIEREAIGLDQREMKDVLVVERAHLAVAQQMPQVRRNLDATQAHQIVGEHVSVRVCQPLAPVHRRQIAVVAKVLEHERPVLGIHVQQAGHPIADPGHADDALVERGLDVRTVPRRRDVVVLLHPGTRLLDDQPPPGRHHPQRAVHVAVAGARHAER